MEVIKPKKANIDEMAEKVFMESIRILGGLKKLIDYRNEAIKTYGEIARELGITEQTAKNIATADEEKPKEHVAGGIAKLAYKNLKKEEEAKVLGIEWALHILIAIKGLDFPVEKHNLVERLKGIKIMGKDIKGILEKIEYPVKNPAELLHKIKEKI